MPPAPGILPAIPALRLPTEEKSLELLKHSPKTGDHSMPNFNEKQKDGYREAATHYGQESAVGAKQKHTAHSVDEEKRPSKSKQQRDKKKAKATAAQAAAAVDSPVPSRLCSFCPGEFHFLSVRKKA